MSAVTEVTRQVETTGPAFLYSDKTNMILRIDAECTGTIIADDNDGWLFVQWHRPTELGQPKMDGMAAWVREEDVRSVGVTPAQQGTLFDASSMEAKRYG